MSVGVVDMIGVPIMTYRVESDQHAKYMMGLHDDAKNTQCRRKQILSHSECAAHTFPKMLMVLAHKYIDTPGKGTDNLPAQAVGS